MRIVTDVLIVLTAGAFLAAGCRNQAAESRSSGLADSGSLILYVGTYTEKEGHVDGKATGIYIFSMDRVTGQLAQVGVSPSTTNPSYLCIHPGLDNNSSALPW